MTRQLAGHPERRSEGLRTEVEGSQGFSKIRFYVLKIMAITGFISQFFAVAAQTAAKPSNQSTPFDKLAANLVIGFLLIFIAFIFALIIFRYLRSKNRVPRSLSMVTLEILVPREVKPVTEEAKKEEKDIISVAEQLFANLYAIRRGGLPTLISGPDFISFEIVAWKGLIHFYVACPRRLQEYIEKVIHAQYPKALIEESGEYNIFQPKYHVKGAEVYLAKKNYLPIKTYKSLETDPLNSTTNALSKLEEDDGAAVQIIIRPASRVWMKNGRKIARKMIQQGKTFEQVTAPGLLKLFGAGGKKGEAPSLLPFGSEKERTPEAYTRLSPMQEEIAKALEEKSNKLGFEACVRIITSSKSEAKAEMYLEALKGSFVEYTSPTMNNFVFRRPNIQKIIAGFIFRYFEGKTLASWKNILNTEELTSIYHLPTKFTETPNINWLMARDAPPPTNLPREGLLLGKNEYRGIETKVRIEDDDRRRHMYIIGQTGTGKSVFLTNMAIQDIQNGKGVCVVDPHGELIEGILPYIPKKRADDVILFEPFDIERPFGLNMLEYKTEDQKDFAVQEMIAIFYKLFPPEIIGPMFEHNMRNVMLTLMSDYENPGTLAEIPRMFTDPDFQKTWIKKLKDPVVRAFWEKEMAKTSDFHKSEMLGYLISKVGRFVENEMMRNIIGQTHSSFDLRKIMDEGKILLVNLSKGKVGEVNSSLLGLIVVSKIQMAAYSRADIPESQRKDFYLYVDEFQNFATDSFASILAEARKYRLNLIVAHQYITQLKENIRDAVFGNVGTFCSFRIGVEDAEIVAKQFDPVFTQTDLINIERFHVYLKLMVKAGVSKPFTMATYPPPPTANLELAEAIRQLSRLKYGRDRRIVESEVMRRAQLGAPEPTWAGTERTA
jgi:hypothetical protein